MVICEPSFGRVTARGRRPKKGGTLGSDGAGYLTAPCRLPACNAEDVAAAAGGGGVLGIVANAFVPISAIISQVAAFAAIRPQSALAGAT